MTRKSLLVLSTRSLTLVAGLVLVAVSGPIEDVIAYVEENLDDKSLQFRQGFHRMEESIIPADVVYLAVDYNELGKVIETDEFKNWYGDDIDKLFTAFENENTAEVIALLKGKIGDGVSKTVIESLAQPGFHYANFLASQQGEQYQMAVVNGNQFKGIPEAQIFAQAMYDMTFDEDGTIKGSAIGATFLPLYAEDTFGYKTLRRDTLAWIQDQPKTARYIGSLFEGDMVPTRNTVLGTQGILFAKLGDKQIAGVSAMALEKWLNREDDRLQIARKDIEFKVDDLCQVGDLGNMVIITAQTANPEHTRFVPAAILWGENTIGVQLYTQNGVKQGEIPEQRKGDTLVYIGKDDRVASVNRNGGDKAVVITGANTYGPAFQQMVGEVQRLAANG